MTIIRKLMPRKPPAKRLFSGISGSPLVTVDSVPVTMPEPAQTPPVTVVPPAAAKAKPVPRSAITPEIRKQIKDSLASAPQIEKAVVTQQVESAQGTQTVSALEDRLPDPDSIAEKTDATTPVNTRVPAPPRRTPAKQPAYLKSVSVPAVLLPSADPA